MRLIVRPLSGAETAVELTGRLVLGRDDACDVVVDDEKASRRHAAVALSDEGTVTVEDLGSTNGTYVAGRRIDRPTTLEAGQEILVGDTRIALERTGAALTELTPTPQSPTRVERVLLRRSARRARLLAAAATAALVAAIVVVVLVATGGDDESTVPEVVARLTPSTVQVLGVRDDDRVVPLGTGWVLDGEEGLIVTNAHVANAWNRFDVRLGDEDRRRPAELVGVAPCEDLALLRVDDADGLVTVPLGSQSEVSQGDTVVALGFPTTATKGQPLVASRGVVSVVRAESIDDGFSAVLPNVVQTDAAINPGNSGGPLVNLEGELVGVNTFKNVASRVESQFYAIGVDRVKEIVETLRQGRSLGWAGTTIAYPATEEELTARGLPVQAGVIFDRAVPETGAARAGLGEAPALLVALDGAPMDGTERAYCQTAGSLTEGDTATMTLFLAGESEPRDVPVEFE